MSGPKNPEKMHEASCHCGHRGCAACNPIENMDLSIFYGDRDVPRRIPTRSDLRRLKTAANALLAIHSEPSPEDRVEAISDGIRATQSTEDFGYDEINMLVGAVEQTLFVVLNHLKGKQWNQVFEEVLEDRKEAWERLAAGGKPNERDSENPEKFESGT